MNVTLRIFEHNIKGKNDTYCLSVAEYVDGDVDTTKPTFTIPIEDMRTIYFTVSLPPELPWVKQAHPCNGKTYTGLLWDENFSYLNSYLKIIPKTPTPHYLCDFSIYTKGYGNSESVFSVKLFNVYRKIDHPIMDINKSILDEMLYEVNHPTIPHPAEFYASV